jgi:hypothetical protein
MGAACGRSRVAVPLAAPPFPADEDALDLVPEARFAVPFLPVLLLVLLLVVLLLVVLLLVVLFLPVLFLPVLFLPVLLLELLLAVLLLAVLLLAVLLLAVLLLAVLLFELLFFAALFFAALLEALLTVFLLAVLFLPVLLPVAPERFFAPLRFRDEPAPRPPDSAPISSSFRIREAPAIPARVARLRSSATVMSSMLRATSAPSPMFPLTCALLPQCAGR